MKNDLLGALCFQKDSVSTIQVTVLILHVSSVSGGLLSKILAQQDTSLFRQLRGRSVAGTRNMGFVLPVAEDLCLTALPKLGLKTFVKNRDLK